MDVLKLDLYAVLDVSVTATEKEILKAYRKKALKCHPDKNPDNPKAVELFHELSKALEVLTDPAAKAAYDKLLRSREAAKVRHRELDSKRKKLKEDLEARETAAEGQKAADVVAAKDLKAQIERLREQGSKLLAEEQERLQAELQAEGRKEEEDSEALEARLKVRWKAKKTDDSNGGYSEDILNGFFSKYGEVTALIVSQKKKGSAIVEFRTVHSAVLAVQNERGLLANPLTLSWLSGHPPEHTAEPHCQGPAAAPSVSFSSETVTERDFESVVMMNMRRAQEKKRLLEEMQREDEEADKQQQRQFNT